MSAKLVELIEADEQAGKGIDGDPYRRIKRWYTKDGDFVCERDDWRPPEPSTEASREITVTVMPDCSIRIDYAKGLLEKGHTYKFWHPR